MHSSSSAFLDQHSCLSASLASSVFQAITAAEQLYYAVLPLLYILKLLKLLVLF